MNQPPPNRRDRLLADLFEDSGGVLPGRMAARIRRRRRVRTTLATLAVCTVAGFALFQSSRSAPEKPRITLTVPAAPAPDSHLSPSNVATDADLMTALSHESVMIFTLADGQRQIVWLNGGPRS